MELAWEFMVDSGASFSSIKKKIARKFSIEIDDSQSIQVVPAIGQTICVPGATIEKLKVGMHTMENLVMTILDFPGQLRFHGLLGMNFLKHFRFTIEPDTATLILRKIPKRK